MPAPLADWASSSHLAGQWTELLAFFSFTDFRHFLPYGSLPARLSLPSSLTLPPFCFKKKQKHPDTVQESEKGVSEACFWSTLFLLVSAEESVWTVTRTGLWLPETWSGGRPLTVTRSTGKSPSFSVAWEKKHILTMQRRVARSQDQLCFVNSCLLCCFY